MKITMEHDGMERVYGSYRSRLLVHTGVSEPRAATLIVAELDGTDVSGPDAVRVIRDIWHDVIDGYRVTSDWVSGGCVHINLGTYRG